MRILNPIIQARVYTAFDTPFSIEAERDYLLNFPPRGIWKVAVRRSDERLVGFQIMEPFAAYTGAFDHVGTLGTVRRPRAPAPGYRQEPLRGHTRRSAAEGVREDLHVRARRQSGGAADISWSGLRR